MASSRALRRRALLRWVSVPVIRFVFRIGHCCGLKRMANPAPSGVSRVIVPLCETTRNAYCDNKVVNSRYTAFTFLPLNLYEQFRRPLNLYFLFVALLQFVTIIAPVNPLSTLLPLLFAFSLTAVKEGYDDVKRHRQDEEYNTRAFDVLVGLHWVRTPSRDIRVGDVVRLKRDDEVPCDIVVVAASAHVVFVRTENLDGEIDLKARDTVSLDAAHGLSGEGTAGVPSNVNVHFAEPSPSELASRIAVTRLQCPPPDFVIDAFDARFEVFPSPAAAMADGPPLRQSSLTHLHLLPQTSYLKNTDFAIGVAVYTGNETKCGMNKKPAPVKWARIDREVTKYSIIIFVFQMLIGLSCGIAGVILLHEASAKHWYLEGVDDLSAGLLWIIFPLRFFLLTSVMIPISFKFIVDMSKYYMALVLEWDLTMYDEERGSGMRVKNSSIVEDLAQIEYVLSDKTGTLTQNVMRLVGCSVGGRRIVDVAERVVAGHDAGGINPIGSSGTTTTTATTALAFSSLVPIASAGNFAAGATARSDPAFGSPPSAAWLDFVTSLAICNCIEVDALDDCTSSGGGGTSKVQPERPNNNQQQQQRQRRFRYAAVSPDEEALCLAASQLGVVLCERTRTTIGITVGGVSKKFIVHEVFGFTSDRKRMSVLLQEEHSDRPFLLCKGADDVMIPRFAVETTQQKEALETTVSHVRDFAATGLRTLMIGCRFMTVEELQETLLRYQQAKLLCEGRQQQQERLQAEAERGLFLVGATAIEDKLQDNVAKTIDQLIQANVRVWMLTGDKAETAQQIALSCALLRPTDRLINITKENCRNELVASPGAAPAPRRSLPALLPTIRRLTRSQISTGTPSSDDALLPRSRDEGSQESTSLDHLSRPVSYSEPEDLRREVASLSATDGSLPSSITSAAGVGIVGTSNAGLPHQRTYEGTGVGASEQAHQQHCCVGVGVSGVSGGANDRDGRTGSVLLVRGDALEMIFKEDALVDAFANIAMACKSVVCARVTPSQKALVTAMVAKRNFMTLAIGDGGNDVAMIQEAHVGVGIIGKEGQQAARAADFAIFQFQHLATLMFVHGHMSYARTAYVVQYSFYKSMLISFCQIIFNIANTLMSGVSFWNSFDLTLWNGAYTLPQTLFFCLDRVAPRALLERHPVLYRLCQRGYVQTPRTFLYFLLRGVLQATVLMCLVFAGYGSSFVDSNDGSTEATATMFTVAYNSILLVQFFTVIIESRSITWINAAGLVGMPALYLVITFAYSSIPRFQYYGVFARCFSTPFVLGAMVLTATLFVPHLVWHSTAVNFFPNAVNWCRREFLEEGQAVAAAAMNRQLTLERDPPSPIGKLWIAFRSVFVVERTGKGSSTPDGNAGSTRVVSHTRRAAAEV